MGDYGYATLNEAIDAAEDSTSPVYGKTTIDLAADDTITDTQSLNNGYTLTSTGGFTITVGTGGVLNVGDETVSNTDNSNITLYDKGGAHVEDVDLINSGGAINIDGQKSTINTAIGLYPDNVINFVSDTVTGNYFNVTLLDSTGTPVTALDTGSGWDTDDIFATSDDTDGDDSSVDPLGDEYFVMMTGHVRPTNPGISGTSDFSTIPLAVWAIEESIVEGIQQVCGADTTEPNYDPQYIVLNPDLNQTIYLIASYNYAWDDKPNENIIYVPCNNSDNITILGDDPSIPSSGFTDFGAAGQYVSEVKLIPCVLVEGGDYGTVYTLETGSEVSWTLSGNITVAKVESTDYSSGTTWQLDNLNVTGTVTLEDSCIIEVTAEKQWLDDEIIKLYPETLTPGTVLVDFSANAAAETHFALSTDLSELGYKIVVSGSTLVLGRTTTVHTIKDGFNYDTSDTLTLRQGGVVMYTLTRFSSGVYTCDIPVDGTYDIYVGEFDTGKDVACGGSEDLIYHTLTFLPDGGSISGAFAEEDYTIDYYISDAVTLPTATRVGYTFNGWKVTTTGGTWTDTATVYTAAPSGLTGDATLTAQWTIKSYTVSAVACYAEATIDGTAVTYGSYTAGTTGGTASGGGSVDYGGSITLTASPSAGYSFVGWYDNASGAGAPVSTAATLTLSDVTVSMTRYALFKQNTYTITAPVVSGGTAYVSTSSTEAGTATSVIVTYGEPVYIYVTPDSGYILDGLYLDDVEQTGTTTGSTTVYTIPSVTGSKSYTAVFLKASTISFNTNGADGGDTCADQSITQDQAIGSLPAPEKSGCDFAGWYLPDGLTRIYDTTVVTAAQATNGIQAIAKWTDNNADYPYRVGDYGYATLNEAIDAAGDSTSPVYGKTTIDLAADDTITDTQSLNNGYTLTSTGGFTITVGTGGVLNVGDETVSNTDNSNITLYDKGGAHVEDVDLINSGGAINIDGQKSTIDTAIGLYPDNVINFVSDTVTGNYFNVTLLDSTGTPVTALDTGSGWDTDDIFATSDDTDGDDSSVDPLGDEYFVMMTGHVRPTNPGISGTSDFSTIPLAVWAIEESIVEGIQQVCGADTTEPNYDPQYIVLNPDLNQTIYLIASYNYAWDDKPNENIIYVPCNNSDNITILGDDPSIPSSGFTDFGAAGQYVSEVKLIPCVLVEGGDYGTVYTLETGSEVSWTLSGNITVAKVESTDYSSGTTWQLDNLNVTGTVTLEDSCIIEVTAEKQWLDDEIIKLYPETLTEGTALVDISDNAAAETHFQIINSGYTLVKDGDSLVIACIEATPQVSVNYSDETLAGLEPGEVYIIDGTEFTADENGEIALEGTTPIDYNWYGETLTIVKKGETEQQNSDEVTLSVKGKPAAPTAYGVNETYPDAENGAIIGVSSSMEYRLSGDDTWISCSGEEISSLAAGNYEVRIASTDTSFASEITAVTVGCDEQTAEETPAAIIDYINDQITGLDPNTEYVINGETYITDENGAIAIVSDDYDWTGTTLSIVKPGNGTTTTDSAAQELVIPARSNASITDEIETSAGTSSITITNSEDFQDCEFSIDGTTWIDYAEFTTTYNSTFTGLSSATTYTVYVRNPATSTSFASEPITAIVKTAYNPTAVYYTLSFETNGGIEIDSVRKVAGLTIELDDYVTTRDGFTFAGWFSDSQLSNAATSITLNSDTTVYAGWESSGETGNSDYGNVLNMVDHMAYIFGYSDGYVRPEDNITRAETATILYRLLTNDYRDEVFTSDNVFSDVSADLWYNKAVSSLANGGYILGYDDDEFNGSAEITRAEFVAIVVRFIGTNDSTVDFTDVDGDHWAYAYVATAVNAGWISGYTDGSFRPDQSITRAEAMIILNRVLDRGIDEYSTIPDGVVDWADNDKDDWYYYEVIEATNNHAYTGARPSEDWTSLDIDYTYDIESYENP